MYVIVVIDAADMKQNLIDYCAAVPTVCPELQRHMDGRNFRISMNFPIPSKVALFHELQDLSRRHGQTAESELRTTNVHFCETNLTCRLSVS